MATVSSDTIHHIARLLSSYDVLSTSIQRLLISSTRVLSSLLCTNPSVDAKVFLLQCLLDGIDLRNSQHKDSHRDTSTPQSPRLQLLQHEIAQAASQPNFISTLCQALEGPPPDPARFESSSSSNRGSNSSLSAEAAAARQQQHPQQTPITEDYLAALCRALRLAPPQTVALGLALARSPNATTRTEAGRFLRARLPELAAGGAGQLGADALSALLEHILTSADFAKEQPQTQALVRALRETHQGLLSSSASGLDPASSAAAAAANGSSNSSSSSSTTAQQQQLTLTPLFAEHAGEMNFLNSSSAAMSLQSDMAALVSSLSQGGAGGGGSGSRSLAGFLGDLGPAATASVSALRQAIRESGLRVDERQVAQLLSLLARTYRSGSAGSAGGALDADLSSVLTSSLLASSGGSSAAAGGDSASDGSSSADASAGGWNLQVVQQVLAVDYGAQVHTQHSHMHTYTHIVLRISSKL
jgi:hypothetical protein